MLLLERMINNFHCWLSQIGQKSYLWDLAKYLNSVFLPKQRNEERVRLPLSSTYLKLVFLSAFIWMQIELKNRFCGKYTLLFCVRRRGVRYNCTILSSDNDNFDCKKKITKCNAQKRIQKFDHKYLKHISYLFFLFSNDSKSRLM